MVTFKTPSCVKRHWQDGGYGACMMMIKIRMPKFEKRPVREKTNDFLHNLNARAERPGVGAKANGPALAGTGLCSRPDLSRAPTFLLSSCSCGVRVGGCPAPAAFAPPQPQSSGAWERCPTPATLKPRLLEEPLRDSRASRSAAHVAVT